MDVAPLTTLARVVRFARPELPAGYAVRAAVPSDMPAVRQLVRSVRYMSRSGLDDPNRFTVVTDASGALVGAAQIKPAGPGAVELASRIVRPDAQGHGVGRLLLWERLRQLSAQQGSEGVLNAAEGAQVVLRTRPQWGHTYRWLGFEELGVRAAPRTLMMKLTALAAKLPGFPASVMGMHPGTVIDLGLTSAAASARTGAASLRPASG